MMEENVSELDGDVEGINPGLLNFASDCSLLILIVWKLSHLFSEPHNVYSI
jgi:hypothetical protein